MIKWQTKKSITDGVNYARHQSNLFNAKPTIRSYHQHDLGRHLFFKSKKDQLAEERYTEIEKANRILLEKMSNIFQERNNRSAHVQGRSLNVKRRKTQMEKIMIENNVIHYTGYPAQAPRNTLTLQ